MRTLLTQTLRSIVVASILAALFVSPATGQTEGAASSNPTNALAGATQSLDPSRLLTQYVYDRWSTADGLPQGTVNAVVQTPSGYLWLGTEEGLVRFDGTRFTVFDKTNTPAFDRSHSIKRLFVTRDGALWIAPRGGALVRYSGDRFTRFAGEDGWTDAPISSIYEDASGATWIGTFGAGLYRRDGERLDSVNVLTSSSFITDITEDRSGNLWIGTDRGLLRYAGGRTQRFTTADGLSDDFISDLHLDSSGHLWIGTKKGLDRLRGEQIVPFGQTAVLSLLEDGAGTLWAGLDGNGLGRISGAGIDTFPDGHALGSGRVWSLHEDREGSLWIGMAGTGLHRLREGTFTLFSSREGLSHDKAMSITQAADGSMWIGSQGGGVTRLQDGRVTTLTKRDGLSSIRVVSVVGTRNGDVWMGTLGGGLNRHRDGHVSTFTSGDGLPSDAVFALYEDPEGVLWIGTDKGLARHDGRRFVTLTVEDGLSSNLITAVHRDRSGDLWVGTYDAGLNRVHGDSITSLGLEDGLASKLILALYEDAGGALWIGTYEGGLSRLKDGEITTFTTNEGLFNDTVYEILEDDAGFLWMSSNKGIFRVSRSELERVADGTADAVTSTSYGRDDGLRDAEPNGGSQPTGWRSADGRLWFPTHGGVAVVDPARLRRNRVVPPVVIEEVRIDQEVVPIDATSELEPGLRKVEFRFTALSLVAPDKMQYKYMLEGYDEAWIDAGSERIAAYTNLPPGPYTFRVVASNNDGVWNEQGASLSFYLNPFFYQTWWFFVLCAFAVAAAAAGVYQLRMRRVRAHQRELEEQVAARTRDLRAAKDRIEGQAAELRELDRFKTRFFANVSHEFRTPLTMIAGPLENLLAGAYGPISESVRRQSSVMLRNALRLTRLINQLLDLSKLEDGKMKLRPGVRDIVPFLKEIVHSCSSLAEQKRISLSFDSEVERARICFEPDKLEKVFYNLLSNALKFTPGGGSITVSLSEQPPDTMSQEGSIRIQVRDTGEGIPDDQLPLVFDRFHQADGTNTRRHEGTGIGLSLAKELVFLHHGSIQVQSEVGIGTTFTVSLPKGTAHLDAADISTEHPVERESMRKLELTVVDGLESEWIPTPSPSAGDDAPLLLVVDDNQDVRDYVAGLLHDTYRVTTASDGEEGLKTALEIEPDLVISDVMMPVMDGNELCRRIKTSPRLRHVPVILLTARATHELKLEGLEMGADDYVPKPFHAGELRVRIANLLRLREQEKELTILNRDLEKRVQDQFDVLVQERESYERSLLEAKDRIAASDRLKSSILSNLSHEFRTPLTPILGYSAALMEQVPDDLRPDVEAIWNGGSRLLKTLDALLDLSRLEADGVGTHPEPIDLVAVAEEALARATSEHDTRGFDVRMMTATNERVWASLDPSAVDRILYGILDNALKYTSDGEVMLEVGTSGTDVHLRVRDTGIGIDAAFLPHVYDAFTQESEGIGRTYEGCGLGLTLVRRLTDLQGGEIHIESTRGEGTVVTVTFPASAVMADDDLVASDQET